MLCVTDVCWCRENCVMERNHVIHTLPQWHRHNKITFVLFFIIYHLPTPLESFVFFVFVFIFYINPLPTPLEFFVILRIHINFYYLAFIHATGILRSSVFVFIFIMYPFSTLLEFFRISFMYLLPTPLEFFVFSYS